MKKEIRIVTILIAMLTTMLGLTIVSGQGQRQYGEYGFSIVLPQGWTVYETQIGVVKLEMHPIDHRLGFVIFMRTTKLTLKRVVTNMKKVDQIEKDEYQLLSEGDITINDIPGYEFVYTCRFQNVTVKEKMVLLSYHYGQVYEIHFGSIGDTYNETCNRYDQYLPIFEASLATFERYDPVGRGIPDWLLGALLVGTGFAIIGGIVGGIVAWRQRHIRKEDHNHHKVGRSSS